jgi:type I restriction enzyme M protein
MWNQDWFTEADYDNDELDRFPAGAGFPGKSSADWGWVQHMHASLNDTRSRRRRPRHRRRLPRLGQCRHQQGKDRPPVVRRPRPHRECALSAREPLLQHHRPGHRSLSQPAKPKTRQGRVFLVNASQIFEKGDPKNFIPEAGIAAHRRHPHRLEEEEKLSRIVDHAELKKNDYNISPSRYIHTGDAETYRPIAEIVAELDAIEAEAKETDKALREILEKIGV